MNRKLLLGAWDVAAIVGAILFVDSIAWTYLPPEGPQGAAGWVMLLCLLLLLDVPALWWGSRGGSGLFTWWVAILCPLAVAEAWLGIQAWFQRDSGGDLQGIEQVLMVLGLVPVIGIGSLVAALATLFVAPRDPNEGGGEQG